MRRENGRGKLPFSSKDLNISVVVLLSNLLGSSPPLIVSVSVIIDMMLKRTRMITHISVSRRPACYASQSEERARARFHGGKIFTSGG